MALNLEAQTEWITMQFWPHLVAFVTRKPMPLSEDWKSFTLESFARDERGPVLLVALELDPEPLKMRKYVNPQFLRSRIVDVLDCLTYYSSIDGQESPGFMHLEDPESHFYGDLQINWVPGNRKDAKAGLQLKFPEEWDETMEQSVRRALLPLLKPLSRRPEIGLSLSVRLQPAHPKWTVPEKFAHLSF